MGAVSTVIKNWLSSGAKKKVAKDFANKTTKLAPATARPKEGSTVMIEAGTRGKLTDRLAKARLELQQHNEAESASWHAHLARKVARLEKEVGPVKKKTEPKAVPKTEQKKDVLKNYEDLKESELPMFLRKQAE